MSLALYLPRVRSSDLLGRSSSFVVLLRKSCTLKLRRSSCRKRIRTVRATAAASSRLETQEPQIAGNAAKERTCLLALRSKCSALAASNDYGTALTTARAGLLQCP